MINDSLGVLKTKATQKCEEVEHKITKEILLAWIIFRMAVSIK